MLARSVVLQKCVFLDRKHTQLWRATLRLRAKKNAARRLRYGGNWKVMETLNMDFVASVPRMYEFSSSRAPQLIVVERSQRTA